jgi:endonuclease/exonuclease/phosphatase family metal-dependent hydrolase
MRPVVSEAVSDLPVPDPTILGEARRASLDEHGRFLSRIEAFHCLESRPPRYDASWPGTLRVAAFNAERLKNRERVRRLLDSAGVHAALLSEVDMGMARSGNVHTIRELTSSSGEGYVYGVEYVELDLGDATEAELHAGERNACSFHGNAIVSRLGLADPHLIPLEESGRWFSGSKGMQRRIGGRIALAARVTCAPKPFWLVAAHLESKTDPHDRQRQVQHLLRALDDIAPPDACIIGGDFNTKAMPKDEEALRTAVDPPDRFEPLFSDLRGAGFTWQEANLAEPTQSEGPTRKHIPPFAKLDRLVVRGLKADNPRVFHAVDEKGRPISDHEMVVAEFLF